MSTQTQPGTNLTICDEKTGQCRCKSNFVRGLKCDTCMDSMYDLEASCIRPCNCDPYGSQSPICDKQTGQCLCKPRIIGLRCNLCAPGYFNLTSLGCVNECNCDRMGSVNNGGVCDLKTGQCECLTGYTGRTCSLCSSGFWKSGSKCEKCECNLKGVSDLNNICNQVSFFQSKNFLLS